VPPVYGRIEREHAEAIAGTSTSNPQPTFPQALIGLIGATARSPHQVRPWIVIGRRSLPHQHYFGVVSPHRIMRQQWGRAGKYPQTTK
jgi:hypothetical protein